MTGIGRSLALAVVSLVDRRMIWLMLWPVLVSLALWGTAGLLLWVKTAVWIASGLDSLVQPLVVYIPFDYTGITLFTAHVVLMLMFVPLVYHTALLVLGVFGMQAMVDHVAARYFPDLQRRQGGSIAGSVWNGVVALGGMLGLFLITLPLLLVPPIWALAPVAVMGWVNQRLLRYDALSDHASAGEMRELFVKRAGGLYALGFVLALVAYVPVVGFFAPALFALAFVHFALAALRELRSAPIEGRVIESNSSPQ